MFGIKTKIKRWLGLLKESPIEQEYNRLKNAYASVPRFKQCRIKFNSCIHGGGYAFSVPDAASFLSTFKELFVNENYHFADDYEKPYQIVDFGANIGLSMLYFYEKYPNANIVGFEADPKIFKSLEENVREFSKNDGRLIIKNEAVWNEDTTLTFYSQGADGGRVADSSEQSVSVKAVDAHTVLKAFEHIDFLKIDIEGSERVVISAIEEDLQRVDKIFLEYHSEADKPQCMAEIFAVLQNAGFRLYVNSVFESKNPYLEIADNTGFDLQFEVMGIKEQ